MSVEPGNIAIPIVKLLSDLTEQMRSIRSEIQSEIDNLKASKEREYGTLFNKTDELDRWRIRHETQHEMLHGILERIGRLEDVMSRSEERERLHERREMRRLAVLGVLLSAAMVAATIAGPLLATYLGLH